MEFYDESGPVSPQVWDAVPSCPACDGTGQRIYTLDVLHTVIAQGVTLRFSPKVCWYGKTIRYEDKMHYRWAMPCIACKDGIIRALPMCDADPHWKEDTGVTFVRT